MMFRLFTLFQNVLLCLYECVFCKPFLFINKKKLYSYQIFYLSLVHRLTCSMVSWYLKLFKNKTIIHSYVWRMTHTLKILNFYANDFFEFCKWLFVTRLHMTTYVYILTVLYNPILILILNIYWVYDLFYGKNKILLRPCFLRIITKQTSISKNSEITRRC